MRTHFLAIVASACVILASSTSFAYVFTCHPETQHTPALLAPNMGFMLDQSGSMNAASSDASFTRWEAATAAIDEVVTDYTVDGACPTGMEVECDAVRFGIGLFSGSGRVSWEVPVREDSHVSPNSITDALPGVPPGGGTETGSGAEVLAGEASLNDATRPNIGIMITDGVTRVNGGNSNDARIQVRRAVTALCGAKSRANPMTTYVVAFGSDAGTNTNDFVAAAGGTGTCVDPGLNTVDVCALTAVQIDGLLLNAPSSSVTVDPSIMTCSGAINAVSNADLKNAIADIAAEAACTFNLQIPAGYPGGTALIDPNATLVSINHNTFSPPQLDIGNIGDCDSPYGKDTKDAVNAVGGPGNDYEDEGWCFADATRLRVRLTAKLCGEIGTGEITEVFTQPACACSLIGQPCTLTGLTCADPNGGPPVVCTNGQLANMPCSDGVYTCVAGTDTCTPTGAGALPEICNGVDENCDGLIDNVAETETDWPDPDLAMGKHCNFENTCQCPQGHADAVTTDGQIATLLASYSGMCVCGSSLEYDDDTSVPQEESGPKASCSSTIRESKTTFAIWIALLGMAFWVRRKKGSK